MTTIYGCFQHNEREVYELADAVKTYKRKHFAEKYATKNDLVVRTLTVDETPEPAPAEESTATVTVGELSTEGVLDTVRKLGDYVPVCDLAKELGNPGKSDLWNILYALSRAGELTVSTRQEWGRADMTPWKEEELAWGVENNVGGDDFFVSVEQPIPNTPEVSEADTLRHQLAEQAKYIATLEAKVDYLTKVIDDQHLKAEAATEYRHRLAEAEDRVEELEIQCEMLTQQHNAAEYSRKRLAVEVKELKEERVHGGVGIAHQGLGVPGAGQATASMPVALTMIAISACLTQISNTLKEMTRSKTARQFIREVRRLAA